MKRTTTAAALAALLGVLMPVQGLVGGSAAAANEPVTTTTVDGDTTTTTTTYPCQDGREITVIRVDSPRESTTTTTSRRCETQPQASGVSIAASASSGVYGRAQTLYFDIDSSTDSTPTGTATVLIDGRPFREFAVQEDWETVLLPADLPAGEHVVDVEYSGDEQHRPTALSQGPMGALTISVTKAATSTSVSAPRTVKRHQRKSASVAVRTDGGVPATGTVRVYVNGKRVATKQVTAGSRSVPVRLPAMKRGKKSLKVVFAGDGNQKSSSRTASIRVR